MAYYTRQGDQGRTRIYGGHSYDKDSLRVGAYGKLDELNAFTGLLLAHLPEESQDLAADNERIQQDLFNACNDLSTINEDRPYRMTDDRSQWLEERIDDYAGQLKPLKQFVMPGGSRPAAFAHACRTICRTCEREIVALKKQEAINPSVLTYINRLSDFFFVVARVLNVRLDHPETVWEKSADVFGRKRK